MSEKVPLWNKYLCGGATRVFEPLQSASILKSFGLSRSAIGSKVYFSEKVFHKKETPPLPIHIQEV